MINEIGERRGTRKRDIFEQQSYASHRALRAFERASFLLQPNVSADGKERALRWVRLWMDFANARHRR